MQWVLLSVCVADSECCCQHSIGADRVLLHKLTNRGLVQQKAVQLNVLQQRTASTSTDKCCTREALLAGVAAEPVPHERGVAWRVLHHMCCITCVASVMCSSTCASLPDGPVAQARHVLVATPPTCMSVERAGAVKRHMWVGQVCACMSVCWRRRLGGVGGCVHLGLRNTP